MRNYFRFFYIVLPITFILIFIGCPDSPKPAKLPTGQYDLSDSVTRYALAKSYFGSSVKSIIYSEFLRDNNKSMAVCREIDSAKSWGIKFVFLKSNQKKITNVFETGLLPGSIKDCNLNSVRIEGYKNELLYYNSLSYFMGSSMGEVYGYLVDAQAGKVFSAHLFILPGKSPQIYLNAGTNGTAAGNFLLAAMREKYRDAQLTQQDYIFD